MTKPQAEALHVVTKSFLISDMSSVSILARKTASIARTGDVIALRGNIGVGKTTFARYFISSIAGKKEQVPSPTFNLVLVYTYSQIKIWHFDLYRLSKPEEVWELGMEEAFAEGISLMEWSDKISSYLPENHLDLVITVPSFASTDRRFIFSGYGDWRERLALINYD